MKTIKDLREGYASAAQRKAVWAARNDAKKEETASTKATPSENASCGYGSKKKTNEISKDMAGRYLKKVPTSAADAGRDTVAGSGKVPQGVAKVINRYKGTKTAVDKLTGKAKVPATESVEEKTAHVFDNEKDARAKAKEIGGKYVRGKGVSAGKHAAVKEDSDAVKAFLAKGGKIKKLPPAKAQGYHGKDDPGKDVAGVMDKPDTDKFKTKKKVKSMEGKTFDNLRAQLSESMLGHSDAEKLNGGKSKDPNFKSPESHIDHHHRQSGGHNKSGGDQDRHRYQVAKKLGYDV